MSGFGFSVVAAITVASQLADKIYNTVRSCRPIEDNFRSFRMEIDNLRNSLAAVEQLLFSKLQTPSQDANCLNQTVSGIRHTLEEMMSPLKKWDDTETRLDSVAHPKMKRDLLASEIRKFEIPLLDHRLRLQSWLTVQNILLASDELSALGPRSPVSMQSPSKVSTLVLDWSSMELSSHKERDYNLIEARPNVGSSSSPAASLPIYWVSIKNKDYDADRFDGRYSWAHDCYEHFGRHWRHNRCSDSQILSRGGCQLCHQKPKLQRSALQDFVHRVGIIFSLKIPKPLTLLSLLLLAPFANALTPEYARRNEGLTWMQEDLRTTQTDLLSLWTHPFTNSPITSSDPSILLLATFLGTSTIALAAQAGTNDIYQPHIVVCCAVLASIAGAVVGLEVRDLVFGCLFWGCVVGVGGSWIGHRILDMGKGRERDKGEKGGVSEEKSGS